MATDLAQEAFVRLYRRGSMPDSAQAWLVSVALNMFRNERSTRARRARLLQSSPFEETTGAEPGEPAREVERRAQARRVRGALDRLDERDRGLLVLRAEGMSYRDMAAALQLHEASIGTLLARARREFCKWYGSEFHAS